VQSTTNTFSAFGNVPSPDIPEMLGDAKIERHLTE